MKIQCSSRLLYFNADLSVPNRVDGVGNDRRAPFLSMVSELWEASPLPRMYGHLQVGVGVEEHPLLQAHRSYI